MSTLFGYLYNQGFIKNNSVGFKIWIWSANRWWNQWLLIPYHVLMGIRYGYNWDDILIFCRKAVMEKK